MLRNTKAGREGYLARKRYKYQRKAYNESNINKLEMIFRRKSVFPMRSNFASTSYMYRFIYTQKAHAWPHSYTVISADVTDDGTRLKMPIHFSLESARVEWSLS